MGRRSDRVSPSSFEELRRCVKTRSCSLDKNRMGSHVGARQGAEGQRYIDRKWLKGGAKPLPLRCLKFEGMEPYVILRRASDTPLFDPLFYDYGGNKQTFVESLRYYCACGARG